MKLFLVLFVLIALSACSQTAKKNDVKNSENVSTQAANPDSNTVTKKDASSVSKAGSSNAGDVTFVCKNGEDERTITNMKTVLNPKPDDKKICQVVYKKFNENDVVAYAYHQVEYCNDVIKKVVSNLETGGFKCEQK